jgi:hypothetical protein
MNLKQIIVGFKMIGAVIVGLFAVLGVYSLTTKIQIIISALYILLKILIWVGLIVIAIAIWVDWYLRNHP